MKRILINFPTNLGDVILGLPVLDRLKGNFPESRITAIASEKTRDFLSKSNVIDEVLVYDKSWPVGRKRAFSFSLRRRFDAAVDLKNSALPLIVAAPVRSPFLRFFPKNMHITDKYLSLVSRFTRQDKNIKGDFILDEAGRARWQGFKPSVFIACSSRSIVKKYPYECLKELIELLSAKFSLVILGLEKDRSFYKDILDAKGVTDLVGKTRMVDVFYLIKSFALMVIGVDSSILHTAGYLNIPAIALFGPTHPGRSHPKSERSVYIWNKDLHCTPCEKPTCRHDHECLKIDPREIADIVDRILCKTNSSRLNSK